MMPPEDKKHCSQTLPPDVLSNLPEYVIDSILMCLPFKDAVRTSVLSNNWRYKWCGLPELTLDEAVWTTKKNLFFHTAEITKIISHILIFHAGAITKFILCVPKSRSCHMIDDLIYFLSKNGIQHFVLELPFRDDPHKLPSSFFKCLQLRHLTLQKCLVIPPPAFKGFDRLIRLELCEVTISSELLGSLISHCLLLEHLVLHIADSYSKVIEINAPRLRSFYFAGSIRSILIKSAPLLEKLLLADNETGYFGAEKWDIVKFFESFSALEHLCVNMLFAAEVGEMPTRLPFDLSCVKQLYITVDLYDSAEVSCALCLIRSFPCIQYMEIQEACCNDSVADHRVELPSDVTFNHLKEVKLIFTSGSIIEMQLAKLLLVKSPALVRMLIESCRAKGTATVKKLVDELTTFQGASPEAEVVFIKR
ncbi:F-box/FBD/LRR-repeat protein At1g13570 [Nicotiana tabacum]|uniref:F-box/FBD/LRR-repeat protein At1g13570 n=1 Tax=Nicotiana tabacum TaxID=4097 RepID=A0A1S3XGX0_TOBAC|nr:PREDICTED: F-box/FBD/LRR-repeat protein At1g13570-like isoform X1 [Nicotiana tabacum]